MRPLIDRWTVTLIEHVAQRGGGQTSDPSENWNESNCSGPSVDSPGALASAVGKLPTRSPGRAGTPNTASGVGSLSPVSHGLGRSRWGNGGRRSRRRREGERARCRGHRAVAVIAAPHRPRGADGRAQDPRGSDPYSNDATVEADDHHRAPEAELAKSEAHGLLPEPEPRRPLHGHLGRRPPRRAARHVRGPAARRSCRTGRRGSSRPTRATRSGSSTGRRYTQVGMNAVAGRRPRDREGRAVPLRPDAPGLLGHRRPHPRHGHQRRVGVAQLPVDDHRLLRPGVLAVLRSRARARRHPGVERLAVRGVVVAATPSASSRWASRSSPTPRSGAAEIRRNAERGLPRRSRCPSGRTASACRRSSRDYWDPIIEACAETDTVICLHVGSSGMADFPPGAPGDAARRHAVRPAVARPRAPSGCGRARPVRYPT